MKGQTVKFIHHFTGEWVRPNGYDAAVRTDSIVTEYDSLDAIENKFTRDHFAWMLEHGEIVTSSGSHVYQIRQG